MLMVKIKYQTGIATLIQFLTMSLLGIANGMNSIVTECRADQSGCTIKIMLSLMFFLLTASWFGAVWILGYMAQESRDRRLAVLLILVELLIIAIALFNAQHHTDALSLFTSIADISLAIWVISLAVRLYRANGKRIRHRKSRVRPSSPQ